MNIYSEKESERSFRFLRSLRWLTKFLIPSSFTFSQLKELIRNDIKNIITLIKQILGYLISRDKRNFQRYP